MSKTFTVKWEIDIDAECPIKAAQEALEIHRDPSSVATQFSVVDDKTAIRHLIDAATGEFL